MAWNENLTNDIETAVASKAKHVRYIGGAGSGKTLALVSRVAKMIEEGANPACAIVFVPTPTSVETFKARLAATNVKGIEDVRVTTIRSFALEFLSKPETIEKTGRYPRVLTKLEETFFNEDMKVTGILPKRLQEILKFFYREFIEFENFNNGWIVAEEEETLLKSFYLWMDDHKAMHESEVLNVLAKYMIDNPVEWKKEIYLENVFVDDYQDFNMGAQKLICMMAEDATIAIAGNENQTCSLMESFPNPDGIETFAQEFKDTETFTFTKAINVAQHITAMSNSLLDCPTMNPDRMVEIDAEAPLGEATMVKWTTPDDEIRGIARVLQNRFEQTGDDALFPGDVFIVVPNKVWGKNFQKYFDKIRVKTSTIYSSRLITGDPRDLAKSVSLRAYVNLAVVADPKDPVNWRCYMGFGDHLTNSLAWDRFRKWCHKEEIGIIEGLERVNEVDAPLFADCNLIREKYKLGCAMIKKCEGRNGFGLLHTLAEKAEYPRDVNELFGLIDGNEPAEFLYKRAYEQLCDPAFILNRQYLRMGSYETLVGQNPRLVIFAGLIDGFFPSPKTFDYVKVLYSEQDRIRNAERKVFHTALAKTREEVIISYFQKEEIYAAEKLRMEIHRVRAEGTTRVVTLTPSSFITDMGSSVPGTVSGSRLK